MKYNFFFQFQKGGIAFIGLKGIMKIYYKQQQFLRQAHRQIKNYDTSEEKPSNQSGQFVPPQAPSLPSTSSSSSAPIIRQGNSNGANSTTTVNTTMSDTSLHTNNINIARRSRNVIRTNVSPIDDFTLNDDDSSSLPDLIIPTSSVINETNSNNDDDVQES